MKKVIIPAAILFVIALGSCKTGTTTQSQESVDSLKQVEDVLSPEVADSVAADTMEVMAEPMVAE